jgi:hypothetical protein
MNTLTSDEVKLIKIWNRMNPVQKKKAVEIYERMSTNEPELMGVFPLFAALIPAAKKVFGGVKNLISKPKAPPPVQKTEIPWPLVIGGGALLLLLLTR